MKILVVEDSITQAVAIQRILTAQGWEVALSRNGKEGLERIPDFQPDIVITDLVMPEMDGFEMCKALKESPQKHIPVILLSAIGEIESKIKGLNVGADDYLTKPVRELELMARISSTMRIKQYQDQLQQALQDQRNLNRQMLEGLAQAKVTQSALLPSSMPSFPGIRIAAKYVPMEQIGGDIYDVVELGDSHLGFFIGDVTGHGIPAALISFMVLSLFRTFCENTPGSPDNTLRKLNDFLCDKIEAGKYLTAWYGILDKSNHTLRYSSAGHPHGFLIRHESLEVELLDTPGIALGLFPSNKIDVQSRLVELHPGDKVFIYTDGIIEITGRNDQPFGQRNFQKLLLELCHLSVEEWLEAVYAHVLSYSGSLTFNDDIALLGLEIGSTPDGGYA